MSEPSLRLLHFMLMFFYIAFAIHHVYSAWLYDIEERCGELSSIITGYKADVRDRSDTERDVVVVRNEELDADDDGSEDGRQTEEELA